MIHPPQDEFKRVVSVLEDAILATDLAVYFRRRKETFELLLGDDHSPNVHLPSTSTGLKNIDWKNEDHR